MISPKRIKYRKPHRGRIGGTRVYENSVLFGDFGLQAKQFAWVTSRQIESRRRVLTRYTRRGGKLWIRVFPDKSVTRRAAETRIGSGKGNIEYWVAVVQPNTIIFEIYSISTALIPQAIKTAASKLPLKAQVVKKENK
jgi:large subunit ribosomal protein L16